MNSKNESGKGEEVSNMKTLRLVGIVSLIVVLVSLSTFGGARIFANNLYTEGIEAYQNMDSELAVEQFTALSKFPGFIGKFVQEGQDKLQEVQDYEQAQALWQDGDYKNALSAHKTFLKTYDSSPYQEPCLQAYHAIPFEWANAAQEDYDYATAVSVLSNITSGSFPTEIQERAITALPAAYIAWGEYLIANQSYDDAIAKLDQAYQSTENEEESEQAESLIRDTFQEWANSHRETGDFEDALGVYSKNIEWMERHNLQHVYVIEILMVETHFEWGKDLSDHQQFEDASAQFNLGKSYNYPNITSRYTKYITYNLLALGKSLFESGNLEKSVDVFGILILEYPDSSEVDQIPVEALDPLIEYGFSIFQDGEDKGDLKFKKAVAIFEFATTLGGPAQSESLARAYYGRGLTFSTWG
jgi:tetratricopeptide (TPR) repeat protein